MRKDVSIATPDKAGVSIYSIRTYTVVKWGSQLDDGRKRKGLCFKYYSLETDFSLVSQQGIASASATAPFPSTNEKSVSQTTSAVPVNDAFGD